MSQVISAKVSIQIPDNFELINKEDYQKLKRESTFGRTWNLNDLRKWCGNKSPQWLKENFLENPKYSREMQALMDDRYLVHRGSKGSPWLFKATKMQRFLEDHWSEFNW